jgi:glycosyltransferase involved in cell wall biosynthesis
MKRLPLRRLALGPRPSGGRICFHGIWFRGHNNPRYEELLRRLERLDRYLVMVSDRQPLRGLEYRALSATKRLREAALLRLAGRRYQFLFTTDNEQIALFPGLVVSDVDDPRFTDREVELLNRPNVAAYVVTAERAATRFAELGVHKPHHVIPQGVSLRSVSPQQVGEVAARRRDGRIVIGYIAAWLLTEGDRGGSNPLYNVDHLLGLWDEIHARVPGAQLWLIGGVSARVRSRCGGRDDVLLLGRLPRTAALAHVANFDIALYPRARDQGIQSAKIAEYMGLGVPTVSYDYEVTAELRESGAGVLVGTPREFVGAVERLARDEAERRRLAEAARAAGAARDWDVLAARYGEILDRYLPLDSAA